MCRVRTTLVFLILAAVGLLAQRAVTFEKLQVADTPVGLAVGTLDVTGVGQVRACQARVETAQIRYRFDGGVVTSTTGMLLEIGDVLDVANHADASALRFAKTGSTTGVVSASCWP